AYAQADQIADAQWSTSWTPPSDGTFLIVAIAEDWAGNVQSVTRPSEIHVASAAPTIDIAPTVITSTLQLGPQVVALGGNVGAGGDARVEVRTAPNDPFSPAALAGTAWQFNWNLGS